MAAKRFTDQVGIQQQNLSTGFTQGASGLLNRLNQFKKSTDRLITTTETKKGQEEAQQVNLEKETVEGSLGREHQVTSKPKKKESGFFEDVFSGGAGTAQYNKALETAYLASLGNDTKEAISAIEAENPDNILGFNEKAEGYAAGVMATVDPAARQQVKQFIDGQVSNSRSRVHRATIKKNKANAIAESNEAITSFGNEAASLAREGNSEGAAEAALQSFDVIDGLVESGDLMADKAANVKREINREMTEQGMRKGFDDLVVNEGLEAAFIELDSMSNNVKKGWTPDEWDTFIASEQADLRQKAVRMTQANAKSSVEMSKQVSDLKIQANTGFDSSGKRVNDSEIIKQADQMFDSEQINGASRASMITSVINRQKKDVDNSLVYQKVAAKLQGAAEIPLTQKEIDLAYNDQYAPSIDLLPPAQKNAAISEFINSTKVTPSAVIQQVNNNLNSEDPVLVKDSVDLMQRLDAIRGIPSDNFNPNQRAYAVTVTNLALNMDPAEAIQLARKNTDPNDGARIELKQKELNEAKVDYLDKVQDEFNPFWGSDLVSGVNEGKLTREYKALYDQHFIAGMSDDSAHKTAIEIIERNWGESSVTGKPTLMRYRPEDYYSVAGNTDYIGDQLYNDVVSSNVGLPEFDKDQIHLMSDERTSREAGSGQPSYMVTIDMGDDGLVPLVGVRFIPDQQAEVKRQQDKNLKELNKERRSSQDIMDTVVSAFEGSNF